MYSIFIENGDTTTCIYNDIAMSEERKLVSPKLELSENSAGKFDCKIPPVNAGYDLIERISTRVIVKRKNEEIWAGRVLTIKEDFMKNKTITAEGEMAYLNDTIQEQEVYEDTTTPDLLDALIAVHNSKSEEKKRFIPGYATLSDDVEEAITNYDSTLEAIKKLIIDPYGGYLSLSKTQDGKNQINYNDEADRPTSSQVIRFGENLLDFTKNFDSTDFCTVVLPLGARIQDQYGISASGIEGVEAYRKLTDSEEFDSDYVSAGDDVIAAFGRIEKVVKFSDINDEFDLYDAAVDYLASIQFDNMVLECSAVDLSYMNVDVAAIRLSEQVRVISRVHGLDRYFPVTRISIPIDNPASTTFTMGSVVTNSLTTQSNMESSKLYSELEGMATESEILNNAKRRADDLINSFTTGYITITEDPDNGGSNELFVTDTKITTKEEALTKASRYWRWNLNGLGYYNKNDSNYNNPNGLKLALTMNGEIVADFITAGTLNANIIRAGLLRGLNNGDNWWNLETGELHISASAQYGSSTFAVAFNQIKSTVAKADNIWDTTGYSITGYGYEYPSSSNGFPANNYSGKYYLNQTNGYIYYSNGSSWTFQKECTKITAQLSSSITQTANAISAEVTARTSQGNDLQSQININANAITTKVSAGDVHSIISQDAHSIRMMSDTLVVNSNNFKLDESGNMECSNALMNGTVTSDSSLGFVTLEDGEIKGGDSYQRGKIDFHGTVDGRYGTHIQSDSVVFSTSDIGITRSQGDYYVSFGTTASGNGWEFIHGICTSMGSVGGGASGTLTDGWGTHWQFENGLLTSIY